MTCITVAASLLLAMTIFFLPMPALAEVQTSLWQIKKSDHFIIYFQDVPLSYIDEVMEKAEYYYKSITDELGFTRYDSFWTWDKRAKIYLFKTQAEYRNKTNQPKWSAAGVNVIKHEIVAYLNMKDFFDITLPHEMGHIIFREFIGYDKRLPLFLDEGVASFLEKGQRPDRLLIARALAKVKIKAFMNLTDLSGVVRGGITMPDVFYSEAASFIDFLIEVYGKDRFVSFCKALRDLELDQDWTRALIEVYSFDSFSEMNDAWVAFLVKK